MNTTGDPAFALFAGTHRFTRIGLLGRGSMGVVYRVHDAETSTDVALKTLPARTPEQLYHLKQEFRALTGIVHPNLVELYELIVDEHAGFFTMELVNGTDFVDHVRQRAADALLDVAGQLVRGLATVHAAGKLHRDVKPPNILVTHDGRVVLLDFGLALALGLDGVQHESGTAGTFAYMAPEILLGSTPFPAADWYSVGVVLFEALTGRLPFEGDAARVFQDKLRAPPPSMRAFTPAIPAHVDNLVRSLLDPEPSRRPMADEILDRLRPAISSAGGEASMRLALPPSFMPFVGRAEEMGRLREIFTLVRAGRGQVVHVLGPSGIGKTELIRRFLSEADPHIEPLILRGRCHPQEAVPYKALDGVVDALSHLLLTLPEQQVAALVPEHIGALTRLFPVLARVAAFNMSPSADDVGEPHELRRRGFSALRTVLTTLAAQQPLILWIDDLQWGDVDSAALLRELLRPPEAPAMLLLLSYRSEDRVTIPFSGTGDTAAPELPHDAMHEITLAPLEPDAARALARQLCATQLESDQRIAEIVAESAGYPFFISELARSLDAGQQASSLRLTDVMNERIQQLSAAARDVLEVVSVAGGALPRSLALNAAGIGERGRPIVTALEQRRLLRRTTLREQVGVEVYHDRIRETLVAQLSPGALEARHGALADSWEQQPAPDPDALFRHSLGAGRRARAGEWAIRAADRAATALAFDRAAHGYRQALDLRDDESERATLLAKLAEALANAGRGSEAAETFEAAADALTAQSSDRAPGLDLRRRAAEHYLRTGHLDAGIRITRAVLADVGITYPDSPRRALISALTLRGKLAWRGVRPRLRRLEDIAPQARMRLAACWGAASSLAPVDEVTAEALGVRHLLEALDLGDAVHVARALGAETSKTAQLGGKFLRRRCTRLLQMMEQLVHEHGQPYEHAYFRIVTGATAYQTARWRTAHEACEAGIAILREHCRGVSWEIATAEAFSLSALAHMGEIAVLARRLPAVAADAEERGDLYAAIGFRAGVLNLVWLAEDRPAYARQLADGAMARWPAAETFHVQHYLHLIASVHADLYVGDAWGAWRRIEEAWPKLRKALLLSMESPRVELRNLRARAALACAAADPQNADEGATPPDPQWPRARLLRLATDDAARIARAGDLVSAQPFAQLIRAGVARCSGREDVAVGLLRNAEQAFGAADMHLYAAAARHQLGALLGGTEGHALQQAAAAWLTAHDIRNPTALLSLATPVAFIASAASLPTGSGLAATSLETHPLR